MKARTALIGIFASAMLIAQATAPKFESATISESQDPEGHSGYFTAGGKLTLQNQTLRDCARIAYDASATRVSGGLKWVETQRFNIEVQGSADADEKEIRAMLRDLLENRFKMKSHRESKSVSGYALMLDKGGLKIPAAAPGPGRMNTQRGLISGECASMGNLAQALSVLMNAPVVDVTSRSGVFSFMLQWRPESVVPGALTTDDEEQTVLPNSPQGPSLFAALQEQLGLRLENRKVPIQILMIDAVERPKD